MTTMAKSESGSCVKVVIILTVVMISLSSPTHASQLTNRLFEWTHHKEHYLTEGKALTRHVIFEYSHKYVSSQCALECLRHHQCRSFNFDRGTGRCELNGATHLDFPEDIEDQENSEYHVRDSFSIDPEALGPCASDPCNGRGHCIETKNWVDDLIALCICHDGWTGSRCHQQAHTVDWGEWEVWGQCSVTCNQGWRMRKRKCVNEVTGQSVSELECYGSDVEYAACVMQDCPRWQTWGDWESCSTSTTCGAGNKLRHRACSNGGVAGVDRYCLGSTNQSTPCQDIDCRGAMRLHDGQNHGEGRLEVYNDLTAQWGTVCVDQLTPTSADLACRQMGYPGVHAVVTNGQFNAAGSSHIALTDILCKGGERTLLQCVHNPWVQNGTCEAGLNIAAGVKCNVDGAWSLWSSWGECSVTCENGTRHRTRVCNHPPQMHAGKDCEGEDIQYKPCTMKMCPIDGEWLDWSDWSQCSLTCGNGTQDRTRTCHGPFYDGADCTGDSSQRQVCKVRECPVDGVWRDWGTWTNCSLTCGNGTRSRRRTCNGPFYGGEECEGDREDWERCNTFECPDLSVDGQWRDWSEWGTCSVTCGDGIQHRNRTCDGPYHGGENCTGNYTESQHCHPRICPVDGHWMDWEAWSQCTSSCGGGSRVRSRECYHAQHGGKNCDGESTETEECQTQTCPVDGEWLEWTDWGECSQTCGSGSQIRTRGCDGPWHGGANCTGPWEESQMCNPNPCPVDGVWDDWAQWSQCSLTCGGGSQLRTRNCTGPLYGGAECPGSAVENRTCNDIRCPADGYWMPWTAWTACSATCGGGDQQRERQCEGRLHGGRDCQGDAFQNQTCNSRHCPVDGVFSDWSEWSACTLTCSGGSQWRNRTCFGPFNGGSDCVGLRNETRTCNSHTCPVNGYFDEWEHWGACSVSCGSGTQHRHRLCIMPQYGGKDCEGPTNETQACNTHNCPVDGYYHEWSDWMECSVTCGGGIQWRNRTCEPPQYGGRDCEGPADNSQECNTLPCPIDGKWKDWSDWSACNTTCGGGMRERVRVCEEPQHGGSPCEGVSAEYLICATNPCPIPGDWLAWTPWSPCTVTCGGGKRERSRECDMTSYGNLTAPCEGPSEEIVDCHTFDCTPLARTCSDWQQRGLTASTVADIDPDGEDGELDPVEITCDFDSQPGAAITVIEHDSEERMRVQGWEGALEYKRDLVYNISINHVIAIVDQSASCSQYIRWECKAALIHNPNNNNQVTTGWMNRTNNLADYFGGADPGTGACACGMDNSCVNRELKCNCDVNDDEWRVDEGDLTHKDDLPVMMFVAGDTGDISREYGYHTVGKLKCHGIAKGSSQTVPENTSVRTN